MKVLETILNFLTVLARVIFPRKPKTATGNCLCPSPYPTSPANPPHPSPSPNPLPDPPGPPLATDAGDGSNGKLHRSDSIALHNHPQADWLGLSGYSMMLLGGAGCVYKWFIG